MRLFKRICMHKIKLILSDIDNTILPSGAREISPATKEAFIHAQEAGIVVAPATGRMYAQLPPMFGFEERLYASAVATNGAQVFLRGHALDEVVLPREPLLQLVERLKDMPSCGLLVFLDPTPLLVVGKREDLAVHYASYADICRPVDALPKEKIVKANVFMAAPEAGTRAVIDTLNREIDGLDFDYPHVGFSNVMRAGHNKATGIAHLMQALGATAQEVVAFGDAGNDLTMFRLVEHSVAVANATEEAKALARWHTGVCADDSVALAIEKIVANEWPFSE